MEYANKGNIKSWAEEERPREKLLIKGRSSLSNAELVAILIGSGNKTDSAVDIARKLLDNCQGSLQALAIRTPTQLKGTRGIGDASAARICASMELGRRKRAERPSVKTKLTSAAEVFELIQAELSDLQHEEFWIILLNRSNHVERKICISQGGFASTIADPKKIFSFALEHRASSMILCHNHPSGNLKPSEMDLRLTKKLSEAGKLFELPILDHIIVGAENFFSFVDNGLI